MLENDKIAVRKSKIGGYGIFSKIRFFPGELVDVSVCLVKPNEMWDGASEDYIFSRAGLSALPLSGGAIFNHSNSPNARHELTPGMKKMRVIAIKPIAIGEEIFISYGPDYFPTRNLKEK
ncbi:SET domain-containing protein [Paramecium bursaria Chlorella virus NE-JV-1]|nr:SET domain-containing protein [Paramecium bursaria Chlorella virus NE-JV-1]